MTIYPTPLYTDLNRQILALLQYYQQQGALTLYDAWELAGPEQTLTLQTVFSSYSPDEYSLEDTIQAYAAADLLRQVEARYGKQVQA